MLDARFSHYFYQSLNRLQRGLSAIAELLVKILSENVCTFRWKKARAVRDRIPPPENLVRIWSKGDFPIQGYICDKIFMKICPLSPEIKASWLPECNKFFALYRYIFGEAFVKSRLVVLRKVANRQTKKQTDWQTLGILYITSLAALRRVIHESWPVSRCKRQNAGVSRSMQMSYEQAALAPRQTWYNAFIYRPVRRQTTERRWTRMLNRISVSGLTYSLQLSGTRPFGTWKQAYISMRGRSSLTIYFAAVLLCLRCQQ